MLVLFLWAVFNVCFHCVGVNSSLLLFQLETAFLSLPLLSAFMYCLKSIVLLCVKPVAVLLACSFLQMLSLSVMYLNSQFV